MSEYRISCKISPQPWKPVAAHRFRILLYTNDSAGCSNELGNPCRRPTQQSSRSHATSAPRNVCWDYLPRILQEA